MQTPVEELKAGGVKFTDEIKDTGYGLVTHFRMAGDFEMELYQPQYITRFPDEE